jgi:hypothetical protein
MYGCLFGCDCVIPPPLPLSQDSPSLTHPSRRSVLARLGSPARVRPAKEHATTPSAPPPVTLVVAPGMGDPASGGANAEHKPALPAKRSVHDRLQLAGRSAVGMPSAHSGGNTKQDTPAQSGTSAIAEIAPTIAARPRQHPQSTTPVPLESARGSQHVRSQGNVQSSPPLVIAPPQAALVSKQPSTASRRSGLYRRVTAPRAPSPAHASVDAEPHVSDISSASSPAMPPTAAPPVRTTCESVLRTMQSHPDPRSAPCDLRSVLSVKRARPEESQARITSDAAQASYTPRKSLSVPNARSNHECTERNEMQCGVRADEDTKRQHDSDGLMVSS